MKKTKSFTLIELLVVVAIIAVLVAILLPVLARARDAAKTVVCANNLRTAGTGFLGYAMEYNDWLPRIEGVAGECTTWTVAIAPYIGQRQTKCEQGVTLSMSNNPFWCPQDSPNRYWAASEWMNQWNYKRNGHGGRSYAFNHATAAYPDSYPLYDLRPLTIGRLSKISADTILVHENFDPYFYADWDGYLDSFSGLSASGPQPSDIVLPENPNSSPALRHTTPHQGAKAANYLFAGGQVNLRQKIYCRDLSAVED
jgi:prepilin-type N-terminal cleavage/methylation domain-containing protein/prepilin-type processing-associated H-X9-DG protein